MKNKKINPKIKKVFGIAANVLAGLIVVVAVIIAISTLASRDKQYVSIFGYSFLGVETDSMVGDNKDSFNPGDVIVIKILSDSEKNNLKIGDVVTFIDPTIPKINGEFQLNTHRIMRIDSGVNEDGNVVTKYITKGDNNPTFDLLPRESQEIIGVYKGKSNGIGKMLVWMQTKDGFLATIVVPSALVFVYCLVMVIMNVMAYSKNKVMRSMADKEAEKEAELRARILKELQAEKKEEEKT